jgi:hypothetical protein
VLHVAIGKDDIVPLLMQPDGQMDGESRFSDTPFGIGDHNNHGSDHTACAGLLASNMCVWLSGWQECLLASRSDGRKAYWQACRMEGWLARLLAGEHDGKPSGRQAIKLA